MREFRELSIDLIDESDNIRRSFSEEKLQELAASIRQRGVLKPILVRPNGGPVHPNRRMAPAVRRKGDGVSHDSRPRP